MEYNIRTDIKYEPLELIDLTELADSRPDPWWNQSLVNVNDSVARLGVFHGEFHWHKHDHEDELFLVLTGELLLDFEDVSHALTPHQAMLVPKGVVHRTRAKERTVVLMIESASVTATGDE